MVKYLMDDIFCIRTPSLPICIIEQIEEDIEIITRKEFPYYEVLKEIIFFSSESLYDDIYVKNHIEKSKLESIKNYIIRSSTRCTPFGMCSGVALGNIDNETEVLKNENEVKRFLQVDFSWYIKLVNIIMKEKSVLFNLKYRINKVNIKAYDRIYFLKSIDIFNENSTKYVDLNYTELIRYLIEITKDEIQFSKIVKLLKEKYTDIDDKIIIDTLIELIENEVLISNFIPQKYNIDIIENFLHIILCIPNKKCEELAIILKSVNKYIIEYTKTLNVEYLHRAKTNMKAIVENDGKYFSICKGDAFFSNTVSKKVKHDAEKFVNKISKIVFKINEKSFNYNYLSDVVENEYGKNCYIKAYDLFRKLDKEKLYSEPISNSYGKLKSIIERKVFESIFLDKEEILLSIEDLIDISEYEKIKSDEYTESFDMCFNIYNRNLDYKQLNLNVVTGSNRASKMINRFANVLDSEKYIKIMNKINLEDKKSEVSEDFYYVDCNDKHSLVRGIDISNHSIINEYYIDNILSEDGIQMISLEDVYIYYSNKMILYSKKLGKEIRIISNDMIVSDYKNDFIKFLLDFTEMKYYSPISIVALINSFDFPYIPRIILEGVIVSLKKWNFKENDFDISSFEKFKKDFLRYKMNFKIPDIVCLKQADNKLIININTIEGITKIYKNIKKIGNVCLEENDLNCKFIKNKSSQKYNGEFIFSFFKENNNNLPIKDFTISSKVVKTSDRNTNTDEEWNYYKIYTELSLQNKFLEAIYSDKELDNEDIFFIRYNDDVAGEHIRLRYKKTNSDLDYRIKNIIKTFYSRLYIKIYLKSVYKKELFRYGGIEVIKEAEKFFCEDSKFVVKLLSNFGLTKKMITKEEIYFIGIITILNVFFMEYTDAYQFLNKNIEPNKVMRKKFLRKKNYYLEYISNCWKDTNLIFNCLDVEVEDAFLNRKKALQTYNKKYMKCNYDEFQFNNLILSIIHMFCNRVDMDPIYESEILQIIFLSLKNLINREKYKK